jgi:hypothetical protein
MSGCLYRGDGAFKKIGDSDYKVKFNFLNMFVAADGNPTYVGGAVLLEDHITPLKNTRITLKIKGKDAIVSTGYTDNLGTFNMSGLLSNNHYSLEIDSPEYIGNKEIIVEPNKRNLHELIARKR